MKNVLACMLFATPLVLPGPAAGGDALLILIDRSSSMASPGKWVSASAGVLQALDLDEFDALDLGLLAAPSGSVTGPPCIFNLPVACQTPVFPQLTIAPAGAKSTEPTGHRREIRDWLAANPPDAGQGDAMPLYNATQASIAALRAWPGAGRRILVVITDGSPSCAQLSSRPGYSDCNGCDHDWEHPQTLVDLVAAAQADPDQPIDTFIIGVPGADSYDASGCTYPPYRMRLALSAIAAAGSPENLPANCDGTAYSQAGSEPTIPCHFDQTRGSFSQQSVAEAIAIAREAVIGPTVAVRPDDENLSGSLSFSARPNPARDATRFQFVLPKAGPVTLVVHDISGRLVRRIADGRLTSGHHAVEWDLRDDSNRPVTDGAYFASLVAAGTSRTRKIAVIRR